MKNCQHCKIKSATRVYNPLIKKHLCDQCCVSKSLESYSNDLGRTHVLRSKDNKKIVVWEYMFESKVGKEYFNHQIDDQVDIFKQKYIKNY